MVATFKAISLILSARALLSLALIGAFILAVMAMSRGTVLSLATLAAFCLLTIAPLVALELAGKRPRRPDDQG